MNHTPDPRQALDYPSLPDDRWIIWSGNNCIWPSPNRRTHYLTDKKTDVMRGYALWTPAWQEATMFATEEEARAWLAEHETKRLYSYGANVTTVATMKRRRGYTLEHAGQ
jgi:hypothetical protein